MSLLSADAASANWGEQRWGEMIWAQQVAEVPSVGAWGLGLLGGALLASGAERMWRAARSQGGSNDESR